MRQILEILLFFNIIEVAPNPFFCTIHLFIYKTHDGFYIGIHQSKDHHKRGSSFEAYGNILPKSTV
ncbi:hypothetical protein Fmac_026902 [Flemingia macrophylla]|uniref:Secreted protein n=1 Tax=Flemingia macrophylla TaxID=520843 RepID=A0ABD1LGF9_9FABA